MTAPRALSLAIQRLRASRTLTAKSRRLVPRGRIDRALVRELQRMAKQDERLVRLRERLEGQ